jgi:hypothetical protein
MTIIAFTMLIAVAQHGQYQSGVEDVISVVELLFLV